MFDFVHNNKFFIRVILGIIALTFIGFGVGSYSAISDDPYLAKVGKTKIYQRDLDRAMEGSPTNDAAARKATLENLIRQELLLADARDSNASVSAEQIRKVIAAVPEFQDNGQFSPERYRQFLQNRSQSAELFEEQLRRNLLLQGQLSSLESSPFISKTILTRVASLLGEGREVRSLLLQPADFSAEIKLDDATIKAFYDANLKRFRTPEKIKLDYVMLSQNDIAQSIQVSTAEAQKYYDEHKAQFANEQRRAAHILLTVPADAKAEQRAKIKVEAEALLKEIRANPARFAELARSKSQDPGSAANGGDLGFFAAGAMVKPFDDVVFKMKPGQISEIVTTEFGYHIIKLEEIKAQSFAEVQSSIIEQLQRQKAATQFRSQVEKLSELAYQQANSLTAIENTLKLSVRHSDWLTRNQPSADPILSQAKVVEAAFSEDVLSKKHNSEPIDIGNNQLLVLRVAEHQPERQQALAEVREQIKAELIAKEGAKLAEKKGQALLASLKAGKEAESQPWGETQILSRRAPTSMPVADMRAIFSTSANKLPAFVGVKHDNGAYAIHRIDKVITAPAISDTEREQLNTVLGRMNTDAQLASYLETLRQKYPVTMGKQSLSTADQ
ncbi:SurA N-terminal domain-containing protein [Neisseriaceae bacterium TC5R-5]|nr:SurA N-terminal domain-containing protein [Neisseriaceae bacterium TC5R-5]